MNFYISHELLYELCKARRENGSAKEQLPAEIHEVHSEKKKMPLRSTGYTDQVICANWFRAAYHLAMRWFL